jgi:hypothetical protein
MSVLTGLDAIRKKIDERPKGFENVGDRELTRNIDAGKSRTIRFVQEIDPDSPKYNDEYGPALVVSELQHPDIWWLTLVDTTDEEGECWAVDEGWKSKLNLYVNVVDVETGDVFYLSRSVLGGLGEQIIDSAGARGSITDSVWKISKTGKGMNTRYKLALQDLTTDEIDVDAEDLIDFRKSVLNEVPSDKQEEFVKQIEERVAAKAAGKGSESGADDSDDDDRDVW